MTSSLPARSASERSHASISGFSDGTQRPVKESSLRSTGSGAASLASARSMPPAPTSRAASPAAAPAPPAVRPPTPAARAPSPAARAPTPAPERSPCSPRALSPVLELHESQCSLEAPAFRVVRDWWESASAVLGVPGATTSAADVEESLARASGLAPIGDGLRRRPAAAGTAVSRELTPSQRARRAIAEEEKASNAVAEERDGGGIPGLDFIYRLYAPKKLLDEYELLERECDSTAFKSYSPEEQAELRAQLTAVQSAIEQRENRLNIIAAAVGGLYGSYVGTMSAMLCIFVPQRCPGTLDNPVPHTCNLYENTHELTTFNKAVLGINALTLVMMLLTEFAVFRREKWLDSVLSYNPRKAARYLTMPSPDGGPSVLEQHPYIAHQLLWQNITAGNLARATVVMVLVNLLLSSILILGFYQDGTRSFTSLITNTLLLGSKLLWTSVVCLQSKNSNQGVSLYKTTRVSFNVLDMNYLTSAEYAACRDKYSWEEVQQQYHRQRSAEDGDVAAMAHQAGEVLKHIAVGRHKTTFLGRHTQDKMRALKQAAAQAQLEGAAPAADEEAGRALAPAPAQ